MARGMFHRLPPSPPPSSTQIYPHPTSLQDESTVWRDLILRVWHVAPLRSVHNSPFIIHPFRHLPFPRFGLRTRETGRLLGQEWLKIDKLWLLTARVAFNTVAPCSLSPETNSPSPAQRLVRAGAQKANSYQSLAKGCSQTTQCHLFGN